MTTPATAATTTTAAIAATASTGITWPPALAVSTSVFSRTLDDAQWDALDGSAVAALEIAGPAPQCPLDDPLFLARTRERLGRSRVRLHSVHLPYSRALDLSQLDEAARGQALAITERNLRLAAALGARLTVVHPSAEPILYEVRMLDPDPVTTLRLIEENYAAFIAPLCAPRGAER